jgi:hypothetical protein
VGLQQNGPGKGEGKEKENVLTFLKKTIKQMNSNTNLNSNTRKQCISMYATLNSYNEFVLF